MRRVRRSHRSRRRLRLKDRTVAGTRAAGPPRVLLLAPPSSYRIPAYCEAAETLGVDLTIVSEGAHSVIPEAMGWETREKDLAPYLPRRAEVVSFEQSGHFVHIEFPDEVAGLVTDFLA